MARLRFKDQAFNFDISTSLTILVGQSSSQKSFLAHESIICARSEFFCRAMTGNWAEREERLVKLPHNKLATFALYMDIVYTNTIATDANTSPQDSHARTAESIELCELYVLSEKLRDKSAKNAVLEAMLVINTIDEETKSLYHGGPASNPKHFNPSADAIAIMYDGTPDSSLGRKLMADLWSTVPTKYILKNADELPRGFLKDLAINLLRDQPDRTSVALRAGAHPYTEV